MPNLRDVWSTIKTVPFLLSVVALILGVGPGWWFFLTFKPAEYDPTNAVLTATLIALIWTGYYTYHAVQDGRLRDRREDDRRASARKSILSGVVAELSSQDPWLMQLADLLYLARLRSLDQPMLAEALRNAHLLEPNETAILAAISVKFQSIDGRLERLTNDVRRAYPDYMDRGIDRTEAMFKSEVGFLRDDIATLRKQLPRVAQLLSPELVAVLKAAKDSVGDSDKPS